MNASSALPTRPQAKPPRNASPLEALPVPAKWRTGQFIVLAFIAVMALLYNRYFVDWGSISAGMSAAVRAGQIPKAISLFPIADQLGFIVLAGLTWLASPTAGTIATSTLQEALRRRWVIGFLVFSMLVIGISAWLMPTQGNEQPRFLQDFGTGFIIGMTILIAIFLGVSLVPPEIERRTIFTILSKPVNRLEFLIGKFLGLCLTLLFCAFLLGTFFLVVYTFASLQASGTDLWHQGPASNPAATMGFQLANLAKAMILNYGQLCVLAALSMTLSLIVTPITAITFCFLAYFGGQMSSYWGHLGGDSHSDDSAGHKKGLDSAMQRVVQIVYYALPRMDHFDVRRQLVTDEAVSIDFVWKACSAGLLYVAVLLVIGYLVFSDREF